MSITMDIKIQAVSKKNLDDYLYFFDNMKFHDHPDWEVCYCYSFHFIGTGEEWNNKNKNRSAVIKLISEGKMKGYLAYYNEKPIGWCNANDKLNFERLQLNNDIWDEINSKICSIVCFLIHPEYRSKGVATQLLTKVCADYANLDYFFIEGYPKKGNLSNEDQCHGPLSMYTKLGFKVIKEFENYYLVRKDISSSQNK